MTVRISGFFRDAFPHLVALLDDAIAQVAALDEPADQNFVAAHARADAERLAAELGAGRLAARDDARLRLQARHLRRRAPAAASTRATGATTPTSPQVYEAWGGYAYGRGLDGARARRVDARLLRAASRSRSRTSTRASTTSSTPTTTTSTTAAWSRPCAR